MPSRRFRKYSFEKDPGLFSRYNVYLEKGGGFFFSNFEIFSQYQNLTGFGSIHKRRQKESHSIVLSFDLRGTPWHFSFNIHHHLSFFVTALLGIDLQKKKSLTTSYTITFLCSGYRYVQHEAPYYLGSLQGSNAKNIEYFACSNKKAVVWKEYLQFSKYVLR